MEILSLDVGSARIGVARASSAARLPEPLSAVKTQGAIEDLLEIIKATGAEAIVVGLPRNLSGEDTKQTAWVRNWVRQAKTKIKLPFYWQDEALTSQKAESMKLKAKSADVDSLAAAIILRDWLDKPEAERVVC